MCQYHLVYRYINKEFVNFNSVDQMLLSALLLIDSLFSVGFSIHHGEIDPRISEFVWFEDSDTYPQRKSVLNSLENHVSKSKMEEDSKMKKIETSSPVTFSSRMDDEEFSKYFFSNDFI